MYPSDKRPRTYTSGATKRHDKKMKLENAVTNTAKMENYFAANKTPVVSQRESAEEQESDGLEGGESVHLDSRDNDRGSCICRYRITDRRR